MRAKRTRPYRIWSNMLTRCRNNKATGYKYWGGKGVCVCDSWLSFKSFWSDMSNGYSDDLMLDRIDSSGPYCKENCRWATRTQQNNNKSDNIMLKAFGEFKTIGDWSRDSRCSVTTKRIWHRIKLSNYDNEMAISLPSRGRK